MKNLNAASDDIRQITANLRAGKGTIGALLVDPSVYEDLKMVLGNVERNKALRALVRYSIRRDEASGATVRDASSRPSGGGSSKTSTPPESLADRVPGFFRGASKTARQAAGAGWWGAT
jgi:hypothetical protein